MRPNILLVVLDGVRSANTSIDSYDRKTTPELHRFSQISTRYTQAKAPSNWSLPSHASMFTGLHVPEHNLSVQYDSLKEGNSVWEELINDHDYNTAVFSQNEFLTADQYGLSAGFEKVVGPVSTRYHPFRKGYKPPDLDTGNTRISKYINQIRDNEKITKSLINTIYHVSENILSNLISQNMFLSNTTSFPRYRSPSQIHTDRFLRWESEIEPPWGVCINFMDANTMHLPWPTQGKWFTETQQDILQQLNNIRWDFLSGRQPWWKLRALMSGYDSGIHIVDNQFGRLIRELKARGAFDRTLIIVTADHGDTLGEWSNVRPQIRLAAHSAGIHECLLDVPLLVNGVNQSSAKKITDPVSLTWIPEVIKTAVNSNSSTTSFSIDGPVIAAADHDRLHEYITQTNEWAVGSYLDEIDLTNYSGWGRVLYQATSERVEKVCSWGDDRTIVDITTSREQKGIESANYSDLYSIFKGLNDKGVKASRSDSSNIDESVLSTLSTLGYTDFEEE